MYSNILMPMYRFKDVLVPFRRRYDIQHTDTRQNRVACFQTFSYITLNTVILLNVVMPFRRILWLSTEGSNASY
jgi:hypothetical protein